MRTPKRIRAINSAVHTNSIMLMANVNRSQIDITSTHYNIKSIPITVDDAVMNGVLYSASENKKGMQTMVGNPLTLGHPSIDGNSASARNGAGLDDFYSGGTIKKVYNKSSVWYADASIKKSILNAQDGGSEYADMLENEESIGVSTGLIFEDNDITGTNSAGDTYTKSAINQSYDHLAMLANEAPAGGADTVMRFNIADAMPEHPVDGMLDRFMAQAKAWFVNESESGYNAQDKVITNDNNGDLMDRNKIIALLAGKNISVNADISDADLEVKLTEAFNAKADPTPATVVEKPGLTIEDVTAAVNAAVAPLQAQLTANANVEATELKTQMKAMTTNRLSDALIGKMDTQDMKDHLAANGAVAFNAATPSQRPAADGGCASLTMPNMEA